MAHSINLRIRAALVELLSDQVADPQALEVCTILIADAWKIPADFVLEYSVLNNHSLTHKLTCSPANPLTHLLVCMLYVINKRVPPLSICSPSADDVSCQAIC